MATDRDENRRMIAGGEGLHGTPLPAGRLRAAGARQGRAGHGAALPRALCLVLAIIAGFAPSASADEAKPPSGETKPPSKWIVTDPFTPCAKDCAVTLFFGQSVSESKMTDIFLRFQSPSKWKWDDTYIVGLAMQRPVITYGRYFSLDPEVGMASRFGYADGFETWAAIFFRWRYFPWNDYVRTTLAISVGASYSRDLSFSDGHLRNGHASHVASYFSPELTLGLPSVPDWDLIIRFHHRSNIWNVLSNTAGDSQFWTAGARLRF